MDETAMAFEMPHVRAAATGGAAPLDRISVRDYTREVEIGAFRSERGVTQRIRFNVVLEVSHHAAAEDDDVDKVISYDTITQAIEAQLEAERINLLETLAERIAARCLADPRAVRVFLRIEKLDRIPGALGVEIVRTRVSEDAARLRPVAVAGAADPCLRPQVVYLAEGALADPAPWIAALARSPQPRILCVGPVEPQPPATSEAALHVGLLSIEQNAWTLAGRDPRIGVAASRTELDWALRNRRLSVWAPTKMLTDARPRPALDAARPRELAVWLAVAIGAEEMAIAGAVPPAGPRAPEPLPAGLRLRALAHPRDLAVRD